jgi:hypothetical protein
VYPLASVFQWVGEGVWGVVSVKKENEKRKEKKISVWVSRRGSVGGMHDKVSVRDRQWESELAEWVQERERERERERTEWVKEREKISGRERKEGEKKRGECVKVCVRECVLRKRERKTERERVRERMCVCL